LIRKGYLEQFQKGQKIFRLKPDFVYKGVLVKYKVELLEAKIKAEA